MTERAADARHWDDLSEQARRWGLALPDGDPFRMLEGPVALAGRSAHNAVVLQPMEGADGEEDGSPGPLTLRRYRRFAESGAGLAWLEATAVDPAGRANPRQLRLHPGNRSRFADMARMIRDISLDRWGFAPLLLLQLTHSGRYARPASLPPDRLSAGDRAALPARFAETAELALDAGLDGVDIKACHGYLLSETLRDGPGLLLECVGAVRSRCGEAALLSCRLNLYDGIPDEPGFGSDPLAAADDPVSGPAAVARSLEAAGVRLFNATMGNPYRNPHVNRPFDQGPYPSPEPPLRGVLRLLEGARRLKRALVLPDSAVVASGLTWLRHQAPRVAGGLLASRSVDFVGFGRQAFAYPGFLADLRTRGTMDPGRCCLCCGKCSELMRGGRPSGCPVRDPDPYLAIYREMRASAQAAPGRKGDRP